MTTRLIVTADDFGASVTVNEAIELAVREGIVTSASLMVGAPAAADAVSRARRLPQLKVGLHLVLVCGRACNRPNAVTALVDRDGNFSENLSFAGCNYFFNPIARRQLSHEITAQFEAFKATKIELDHVNAHNHFHLHPTVLSYLLRIGPSYGMNAVRIPYDPDTKGCNLFLRPWLWSMRSRLEKAGIHTNDQIFGLQHTGQMHSARVREIISSLPDGLSEIFFHLASDDTHHPYPRDYLPTKELAAVTDGSLEDLIRLRDIKLVSFSDGAG